MGVVQIDLEIAVAIKVVNIIGRINSCSLVISMTITNEVIGACTTPAK